MKRVCNETERQLILQNRSMLLASCGQMKYTNGYSETFIATILTIIVYFTGLITFDGILGKHFLLELAWIIVAFKGTRFIFYAIYQIMYGNKQKSRFLQSSNLYINGATVVDVDETAGIIYYIEDELCDLTGNPVIVDYSVYGKKLSRNEIGNRIAVVYASDSNFLIMKLNDELTRLVPGNFTDYQTGQYIHVPHPNASKMFPLPHNLNEKEKNYFLNMYDNNEQKTKSTVIVILSLVFVACVMTISSIVGYYMHDILKIILIGLGICALYIGIVLFFCWLGHIVNKNIRKKIDYESVQEVLFESDDFEWPNRTVNYGVNVYEWMNGQFQLVQHSNTVVPKDTHYGDVLYKVKNKDGQITFFRKQDSL